MSVPREVQDIAEHWGGRGIQATEREDGEYTFWSEDHMQYLVYAPGSPVKVYEDSGRPCGTIVVEPPAWAVRCVHDAPDAWFTVSTDGVFDGWSGSRKLFDWPYN